MFPESSILRRRVVVFTSKSMGQSEAEAELQPMFPKAELMLMGPTQMARLLSSPSVDSVDWKAAITWLRQQQFNAAVILTEAGQSPYSLGYLCYLAGIPLRIGRSQEFGGQVLSDDLYAFGKERKREREEESQSL